MRFQGELLVKISLVVVFLFFTPIYSFSGSYWWERGEEGWFFYKDLQKDEEELREEKPRPVMPSSPPPLFSNQPLFTEKMKRWGDELLSRAMEEPTIENVRAYMEYNRLMMKLAENFSLAWQKALMMYPELESPVPVSDSDKDLYFEVVEKKEREILYKLSRKAGLFFFYDGNCPFCERQAYYLKKFIVENPFFVVKPVSLDGSVFEEFPETVMDNGISQRLGVTTVPSIFLAFPPDRFERISNGLVTASELKRRLIWYALEIDKSVYNSIFGR